ncbi:MAG TPA: CBS domain-containing protein, partial [Pirellulales bacterium]|nr:CBS domain-containing protein [Pirellulales bacterium]
SSRNATEGVPYRDSESTQMIDFTQILARDVMQSKLITADPDQSLAEVRHLLFDSHISGAPVVSDGRLVGIVTRSDLVRVEELVEALDGEISQEQRAMQQTDGFRHSSVEGFQGFKKRLSELHVKDAMRAQVVTCSPNTPVSEVAAEMVRHHVHRIVVVEGAAPVGIVSALDLASLVAGKGDGQTRRAGEGSKRL